MEFRGFIFTLLLSSLLWGCDDVASNRKKGNPDPFREGAVTDKAIVSGVHRERGTAPVSYTSEISSNGGNSNIRAIPDMRFDDDGGDGRNVSTRSAKGRPTNLCGLNAKSLKEKIADCAHENKNGIKASWNGTTEAGSAEGSWSLVVLAEKDTADGKYEVWLDKKTGMVWSDIIVTEGNWCGASGSQLQLSEEEGEDCATTGNGKSFCTNLNLAELPKVNWRLPTRHDYLQADLDGIRFVLKPGTQSFWTATVSTNSTKKDQAWAYKMTDGSLQDELMSSKRHIRCIGTPNF